MGIERPEFNVEEPSTWGFADARRRVFAVAVQDGRVYYSVAKPVQIWSVGLNADGGFADDARVEFDIKDTANDNVVTDILFDGPETMFLSQRGGLTGSYDYSIFAKLEKPVVRRYAWDAGEQAWSEDVGEYAVGFKLPHRSTLGGLALSYGYDPDGNINYGQCRETLWTTGEHLREGADKERDYKGGARVVHGLQATAKGDVARPTRLPMKRGSSTTTDSSTTPTSTAASATSPFTTRAMRLPPPQPAPPLSPPLVPLPPVRHLDQEGVHTGAVRRPHPLHHHRHQQLRRHAGGARHPLGRRDDPCRSRRRRRGDHHRRRARHCAVVLLADADGQSVLHAALPNGCRPAPATPST